MTRVVISDEHVTLLARALLTQPASERDTLAWIICGRAVDAAHAARSPGAVRSPYGDGTLAASFDNAKSDWTDSLNRLEEAVGALD